MTRERYIDQWPKPMFLCTHCDEQTDSDPCQECASVFDERGENYPPVLRFQVVPAPAQPEQPTRGGDELAARLEARAEMWERKGGLGANIAAGAYRQAAEMARASTHPEQWVSGDDREWLLWITSYVLNRHEFTDSAATDARAALTRIATAIKQPAPPTPTEQGEDRTRVEWHDGIEHGDELALRQLAADIGCGIPYGCQPSIGKWYAAALDRVLDRLLPLDPAPEQGEARVLRESEIADHAAAGGRFLYDCPQHGLIEDGWVGSFRCEDDNEGDIMYCTLCPASREWAKDELKGPFAFPPAQTEQGEGEAS